MNLNWCYRMFSPRWFAAVLASRVGPDRQHRHCQADRCHAGQRGLFICLGSSPGSSTKHRRQALLAVTRGFWDATTTIPIATHKHRTMFAASRVPASWESGRFRMGEREENSTDIEQQGCQGTASNSSDE